MSNLIVFNSVSVDGYFTDTKGDMSWRHHDDPERRKFTIENRQSSGAWRRKNAFRGDEEQISAQAHAITDVQNGNALLSDERAE